MLETSLPRVQRQHFSGIRFPVSAFIKGFSMPLLMVSQEQFYGHEDTGFRASTTTCAVAYSHRSDTMGSMFIARRAAIPQARNEITDKIRPTIAKLNGSCSFTPYI
jgi:hypothetical protein